MGADAFFRMGSTHQVCQDYAATGERDGLVCAALSDGCSSSPDTDFGARLMVLAGLRSMVSGSLSGMRAIQEADHMADAIGLPDAALDATLLTVGADESGAAIVCRSGDGVIVYRQRDGVIGFNSIQFDENMPLYLSYALNDANETRYRSLVQGCLIHSGDRHGSAWEQGKCRHPIDAFLNVATVDSFETWTFFPRVCDLILVFSDGIESFQNSTGALVPLTEVLDEFMQFKSFAGQFIARRSAKFLKDCEKRGWKHADDFSCAGIYFGDGT